MSEDQKTPTTEKGKRISNENILDALSALIKKVDLMCEDIETIKVMVGFNDQEVTVPQIRNLNNDPGPFSDQKLA